jgi:hemerythrin
MLEWSPTYKIGIDRIDLEHETFFGLVRDFEKARLENADKQVLLGVLDEIALYAKFHFRSEENIMQAMGYPGLEEHKEKHLHLIEVLSNNILGLTLDRITPMRIEELLVEWFLQHTANDDNKIAEFRKLSVANK